MAYIIAEPCIGVKDAACVDACPVDCIHPKKDSEKFATEEMIYIDPVECIDCGACVPVCPVSAIFALDDLPEKWTAFTEREAKYYGRLTLTSQGSVFRGARRECLPGVGRVSDYGYAPFCFEVAKCDLKFRVSGVSY